MIPLDDGTYEVFVVDAVDDPGGDGVCLELAVTTGVAKGNVVGLRATQMGRDAVSLLGLPGVLTVVDGAPMLALE